MSKSFISLDDRLRDFLFLIRGKTSPKAPVLIVDIDEKSIAKYGQFPWERKLLGQLVTKISSYDPKVVGFDIVFAEADKRSPSYFAKTHGIKGKFEDYDQFFADSLYESSKTPIILGYIFDFELFHDKNDNIFINTKGFIKDQKKNNLIEMSKAKGIVPNLQILHDEAYSAGFFNASIGFENKVNQVPLIIEYQKKPYFSLDLEMYKAISKLHNANIFYTITSGINSLDFIRLFDKENSKDIHINRHGQLMVNFRGGGFTYPYVSASDILDDKIDKNALKDKIIYIGTSAKGLVDLRATPMDDSMPGVEVHANLIDNLINDDYLKEPKYAWMIDCVVIFVICFLIIAIFSYISPLLIAFLSVFIVSGLFWIYYYLLFEKYLVFNFLYPLLSLFISLLIALILGYFFERRQAKIIKNKFASKISKNVMEDLIKHESNDLFQTKNKQITIFFSDIRKFSTLSEKLDPQTLIKLLNAYMSPMSEIITKNFGTIDKFIGDAIMAYWNAPQDTKNHADYALQSAIAQIDFKDELNKKLLKEFGIKLDFGIGINTGTAIVGEMGSIERSDYTCLGNSVNIASRLEGLCPIYGVNIIFSQFTKDLLVKQYDILQIDRVRVKGINEALNIYTICHDELFCKNFSEAFIAYQDGDFKRCLDILIQTNEIGTNLKEIFTNRAKEYKNGGDFDGVHSYTSK